MTKKIKTKKILIIAFGLLLISLSYRNAWAGDATLSWYPPLTNVNGSPLTNLAGYKVYYGIASSTYTQVVDVGLTSTPAAPVYTLTNLAAGNTYYFAVTAYDISGNESTYSNEAAKTFVSSVTTTTVRPATTTTRRPATTTTVRPATTTTRRPATTTTVRSTTSTTVRGVTTTTIPTGLPSAALTFSNIITASGVVQSFTVGYSDPDGWQNLLEATFYIAGGGHDQWLHYKPATNRFTLDGATGSCRPGQRATLSTSYLTFNCYASTYSGSGKTLSVTYSVTPKPALSGVQYRLLIYVSDKNGKSDGKLIGNWWVYQTPGPG